MQLNEKKEVKFQIQEEIKIALFVIVSIVGASFASINYLNSSYVNKEEKAVIDSRISAVEKAISESNKELKEVKELNVKILIDLGIIKDKLDRKD